MRRRAWLWNCLIGIAVILGPRAAFAQLESDALFAADRVDRIDLWLHSADWQTLTDDYQSNTYYPADVSWNGQTVRNVGVRSRGSGSRLRNKPGLKLDFNRYSDGQTFLGLKSLVLDNLSQDASMMRERLTFEVFRRFGLPAPRVAHVELYINGTLWGLYTAVEAIDKTFLTRTFGENDGYLFEYDYADEWWFTDLGGVPGPYRQRFAAKTHETAPEYELYDPFIELVQGIGRSGSLHDNAGSRLDLHAFARHAAAEMFIADRDGLMGEFGVNNFYLYRAPDGRARFLVWDKDGALAAPDSPLFLNTDRNVVVARMFATADLRDEIYDALRELSTMASTPVTPLPEASSARDESVAEPGWFEAEARRVYALISEAAARDPHRPYRFEDVEVQGAAVIAFASSRASFVRGAVEATAARSHRP